MKLFTNIIDFARQSFGMGLTHNGLRDTWAIFGYPDKLTIKDFRGKYERGDIATRIVDAYPNACWSNVPQAIEDEELEDLTTWEQEVNTLFKQLDFWKHIRKLDKLVNLGSYAVLYIGFADAKDPKEPVVKGAKPIFLKALPEDIAVVKTTVSDIQNKRFGLPETYEITLNNNNSNNTGNTVIVHWSRVIHVAERTLDNESKGQGILHHIWNKLIDLDKIGGGSAEIFWLNARAGLSLECEADTDLGDEDDKKALKEEISNFQHGLNRFMRTKGITVKPIQMEVDSPMDQFKICISVIAGSTSIPQRILLGNEAGELASSQDENNWNNQIKDRRENFCEPYMLNPFISYMIELGCVKPLKDGKEFSWEWPSLVTISEKDKAEIGSKKASSLVAYANSLAADTIVPPKQFVEDILCMEYREDEIQQMIDEENTAIDRSLEQQEPDNDVTK